MAHINNFLTYIDFDAMRDFCIANGETVSYEKGESFVEAGYVGRYVGFVKSGYFKYCVLSSKGDYAVTGFSFKDECVMDFTQSFLFGKPSMMSIIAGCEAEVIQVGMTTLKEYVLKQYPDLVSHMSAVVLEEAYSRYLNLYEKSPTERYLELIRKYPHVLECVTLRDISSYLLVTPTYLSRIRRKLGE